ncbi:MAG TPA: hypothetical protein VFX98_01505, partial [Longimicrobiaceae bacterium]|nr:hypothetical protein [Longimicrobiaceae bacterium]
MQAAVDDAPEPRAWPWFAGKRVLTVDDSRDVQAFLGEVLLERGAEVEEAATGARAVELCREA